MSNIETLDLKLGEMPEPLFLPGPDEYSHESWVAMNAYSVDKNIETFFWYGNVEESLLEKTSRKILTRFMVVSKLNGYDVTFGPAIDYSKINPNKNSIPILNNSEVTGLYVKDSCRAGFNFIYHLGYSKKSPQLRKENLNEYNRVYRRAKQVLPRISGTIHI